MENEQSQIIDGEALKKELEEFIATAKKEKEKIENLAIGISTKSEEVELYYANFTDLKLKLTDGETGMQALHDQSINLKNQIDQVGQDAQKQLDQIAEKMTSVDTKIQEIEKYYGTFTELKSKIDNGQTGLQALLDQSTDLKKSIDQVNIDAKSSLEQISKSVISITTKVQEIENYHATTFVPLRAKIDDAKTGLQAILGSATNLKDEIVKTKNGVDENFREIKNLNDQSARLKDQSEKSRNEIEEIKKKSTEFKDSIGETLDLVTASSLTDSFIKRRDTISKNVYFWKWSTLVSIIVLAIAVLYIYYLQNKATEGFKDWHSWYRYLFTSPLIYLVYICSHNYNMERDYEEKYAFKTVLSTSLQAYIKLLTDKFADKKDDLLKFTLNSIDRIYEQPYSDKDEVNEVYGGFKNVFNFGLKNNVLKTKATDDIVSQETKDKII